VIEPLPTYQLSDYFAKPSRLDNVKYRMPSRRGWGPGWVKGQPNPNRDKIHYYPTNRLNPQFRDEYAPLGTLLIQMSNALGYDMRRRIDPDGGFGDYDYRPIGGTEVPSFHSWALAIDQNTKGNPRGQTFKSVTPPAIVLLYESTGHDWGGRYRSPVKVDAMHLGYQGRPEDVEADIGNAWLTFAEVLGGTTLYPLLYELNPEQNAAMVRVLQYRLELHGHLVPDDGTFEPEMTTAVKAFQKEKGLRQDGIGGPLTWTALNAEPVEDHDEPEEEPE
jgi:peptidoglycan hydrolase-like protein with peptidoglycan-binding domain